MVKDSVNTLVIISLFVAITFLFGISNSAAISDDCKSCHFNESYMDAAGALNKSINNTWYTNSSHSIIYCSSCHEYDHIDNLTFNGNYLVKIDPIYSNDDAYTSSNFSLCFRCHNESNLMSNNDIDPYMNFLNTYFGIPLYNQPIKTNFVGNSWWKHNESNLHYFHLAELRAMGGTPSKSAVCSNCHDPHGTNRPALVQNSIDLQYIDENGDIITNKSNWNQSKGAKVAGFESNLEYCQPCHYNNNSYMRTPKPIEIEITHESVMMIPLGRATCAEYSCHQHDTDLRILHVEQKNHTCETCHFSNSTAVQSATLGTTNTSGYITSNTACGACHPHSNYTSSHGCSICHSSHGWPSSASSSSIAMPQQNNIANIIQYDYCAGCHNNHM